MQPMVDTMALPPFNFQVTDEDKRIFNQIYADYIASYISEDLSMLFSNITFLLINKTLLDYLLKQLEAEVCVLWSAESEASGLARHLPAAYVERMNLLWPLPTPELASNHSGNLLSRVLLKREQVHQLNLDDGSGAPVPTFAGFVESDVANQVIANHQIWNDNTKIDGVFFHGKMTHRIQVQLMLIARELKLLDAGCDSAPNLLTTLVNTRTRFSKSLAWNLIFDNIDSDYYRKDFSGSHDDPVIAAIGKQYPRVINSLTNKSKYVYGCDPFYLNSYVMTCSRESTPYLSECVTKSFSKAALVVQSIEADLGNYIDNKVIPDKYTKRPIKPLNAFKLKIEKVLKRQETYFLNNGAHLVNREKLREHQVRQGKVSRVVKSLQNVDYLRMFAKPDAHSRQTGVDAGAQKRVKNNLAL
jgi:hypothetical protein